mgnify:CR=1 FL=1
MTDRPVQVDLAAVVDRGDGVVHLDPGHTIDSHVNGEVDVLIVVVAGGGRLEVNGTLFELHEDVVVHVPRGTARRIEAGRDGLRHLTVHRRRGPLRIGRRPTG